MTTIFKDAAMHSSPSFRFRSSAVVESFVWRGRSGLVAGVWRGSQRTTRTSPIHR